MQWPSVLYWSLGLSNESREDDVQTPYATTAEQVLEHVGGAGNVVSNDLCMTRLRLTLVNPSLVDHEALGHIDGVLGTVGRGSKGVEVVFGPNRIRPVFDAFSALTGMENTYAERVQEPSAAAPTPLHVHVSRNPEGSGEDTAATAEIEELARLLSAVAHDGRVEGTKETPAAVGPSLLVLNGPNINLLGMREPAIYGTADFSALLALCHETARICGFAECRCFQSNHEGDLVDAIQDAYGRHDAIVINPGAYTHTSVALLDALKAVAIPAIEVHISKVAERESFRQVSYVREACMETITGEGIEGYAHAIRALAQHLGAGGDEGTGKISRA